MSPSGHCRQDNAQPVLAMAVMAAHLAAGVEAAPTAETSVALHLETQAGGPPVLLLPPVLMLPPVLLLHCGAGLVVEKMEGAWAMSDLRDGAVFMSQVPL